MQEHMTIPSPAETEAWLKQMEQIREFWAKHYQELRQKYPDQFVAIYEGKVVAVAEDLQNLVQQVEQQGISIPQTDIRFLPSGKYYYVL